jgi:hypothetical protein
MGSIATESAQRRSWLRGLGLPNQRRHEKGRPKAAFSQQHFPADFHYQTAQKQPAG